MKPEESIKIKEKLDDVLLAVKEYGKQSEQFSKARNDLFSVLGVMNNTNSSLGQLLTACDQYLKKASEVIDGEYFVKIQGVINEINTTASNLEKCNENTSEKSVELIAESKKQLTNLADTLSNNITQSVNKVNGIANDLQRYSKDASNAAKKLIESSSNELIVLVKKLDSTCDALQKESDTLKNNDGNILEMQKKTNETVLSFRNWLSEEIKKNNNTNDSIVAKLSDIELQIKKENEENAKLFSNLINTIEMYQTDFDEYKSQNNSTLGEIVKSINCLKEKQDEIEKSSQDRGEFLRKLVIKLAIIIASIASLGMLFNLIKLFI